MKYNPLERRIQGEQVEKKEQELRCQQERQRIEEYQRNILPMTTHERLYSGTTWRCGRGQDYWRK